MPDRIFKLTGIEKQELDEARPFSDHAEHIERILRGKTLIAHDIKQDYPLIKEELEKALSKDFQRECLCTLSMARDFLPHLKSYALADLCQLYQLKGFQFHRAYQDTMATMRLLQYWIGEKRIPQFETVDAIPANLFKVLKTFTELPPSSLFEQRPKGAGTLFLYHRQKIVYMKVLSDIDKELIPLLVSMADKKRNGLEEINFSRYVFRQVENELVAHFDLYF